MRFVLTMLMTLTIEAPIVPIANSSMAFGSHIYIQDESGSIVGIRKIGARQRSSWGPQFTVGSSDVQGRMGTQIAAAISLLPQSVNQSPMHVFFQTNESNIVTYTKPRDEGEWSEQVVPLG